MKVSALAALLAIALPVAAHAEDIATPADFGKLFCKGSVDDDMSLIEANLSPGLATAIAEALAKNAEAAAAFPDEKPPLGDGLPWRSWQDYADGCEVGDIASVGDNAYVEIRYSFKDYPDANYSDELILAPSVNGAWQLDDINTIDEGTMRTILAAAFAIQPSN